MKRNLSASLIIILLIAAHPAVSLLARIDDRLLKAIKDGDRAYVVSMITNGLDVNSYDGSDRTLLMIAAEEGKTTIVEYLLSKGASVDERNIPNQTALMLASKNGHTEIVKLLLSNNAGTGKTDMYNMDAIGYAERYGHKDIAKLIRYHIDPPDMNTLLVDAADSKGFTPLMLSASAGKLNMVRLLVSKGAKVNTANVELKKPNQYGLYDMCGRASEWCFDWYDPTCYSSSPDKNPTGPAKGEFRVIRGGSIESTDVRISERIQYDIRTIEEYMAVRVVLPDR